MTRPSPYDLIQKASRAGAADRWAALQANTQSRVAVPQQGEPPFPAAQGAAETAPPARPASHPELIDPPFPPPHDPKRTKRSPPPKRRAFAVRVTQQQ